MARTILITGFPGFIAGQLLRRFLAEEGTTVRLLVIPAMHSAAEAAHNALAAGRERTEIVLGDITKPHLAVLDEATRRGSPSRLTPSITWPRSMTWPRRTPSRGWSIERERNTFSTFANRCRACVDLFISRPPTSRARARAAF